MCAFPVTLNAASPADGDDPSQGALKIRTLIGNVEDLSGIADNTPISAALVTCTTAGLKIIHFKDAAANPTLTGDLQRNGTLLRYFDGTTPLRMIAWAAGTVTLFRQATAPTGWTRVVDAPHTDALIRVLTNNEALADGGSWTISGLTHSHTHTISHSHAATFTGSVMGSKSWTLATRSSASFSGVGNGVAIASGTDIITQTGGGITGDVLQITTIADSPGTPSGSVAVGGSDTADSGGASTASVSSDASWRPLHVDVIAASLN